MDGCMFQMRDRNSLILDYGWIVFEAHFAVLLRASEVQIICSQLYLIDLSLLIVDSKSDYQGLSVIHWQLTQP